MFTHLPNKAISLTSGKDNYTSGTSSFMVGQYLFKRFNKLFTASSEIYHQAKQRQGNEWGGGPTLHISLCDNKRLTVCWTIYIHYYMLYILYIQNWLMINFDSLQTHLWAPIPNCKDSYQHFPHNCAPIHLGGRQKNILFLIAASLTMQV